MSGVHSTERLLCFTPMQLAVIVLAAPAGGAIARHLGPTVMVGEILTRVQVAPHG